MAYFEGYIIGWGFFFVFGPVFFTIIYSTLSYGWRAGLAVVCGIATGDALCLFLFYGVGLSDWVSDPAFTPYLGGIGGIALIGLGINFFRQAPPTEETLKGFNTTNLGRLYIRGLVVNLANPVLWFAWVGFVAAAGNRFGASLQSLWFLLGLLSGIVSQDATKVIFAQQIRRLLRPSWFKWINYGVGGLLVAAGLVILIFMIQDPTLSIWQTQEHGSID